VARRGGIGRGLAAILPEPGAEGGGEGELRTIPVELIRPNPEQPRKSFDPDALARLAASVAEAGVVQPLVVQPLADGRYELIAGERRWRAAREAGLETVPAVMRSEADGERLQTALIENMAREDLNPVEEARACAALVEELGLSKEEVARRVGRSRSAISNLIRLLELPTGALELLEQGRLSEGHGRALLLAKDHGRRLGLARKAAAEGWSVRETERRARGESSPAGRRAPELDADRAAAVGQAEDALERALGRDVRVSFRGERLRAELQFDDLDELLSVAARLDRG
jgi:ParB family transcriptional regulator, chromosome partitioning protein